MMNSEQNPFKIFKTLECIDPNKFPIFYPECTESGFVTPHEARPPKTSSKIFFSTNATTNNPLKDPFTTKTNGGKF